MSRALEVFDKLAEQKYVLKKKKQSKKQKAKRALKRGVSTGVSSGVLTTLFNAGNPNALKHGAKFGGIVVPAVAALSYMGQPNYRMKLKKVANFKQRFISKYMEEFKKEAQVGGMMGKAQGWLPYIAASIVAGSVLQSVQAFIDKVIDKIEQHGHQAKGKGYFEKMLKAHPTLTKEDPEVVAKY
tara:strand:+ start:1895 stop:2446 length:552 start_codon:yes stop_codon:yes gene_type:complete